MIDAVLWPRLRLSFRRTRRPMLVPSLAGIAILATLVTNPLHPVVLFNATPSEPAGLYAASLAPVRVGELVAFKAPTTAFPYADRKLGYLRHTLMLKGVARRPRRPGLRGHQPPGDQRPGPRADRR